MRVQEAGWVLAAHPGTTGVGGQLPPAAVGAGGQWTPHPSPTFLFYELFPVSRPYLRRSVQLGVREEDILGVQAPRGWEGESGQKERGPL